MRVLMTAAMCAVVSFASGQRAEAFCPYQYGALEQATWQVELVKYRISANAPEDVRAAIDAAFATWASVDCTTLRFEDAGTFEMGSIPYRQPDGGAQIYIFWHDEANSDSYPDEDEFLFSPFTGFDGISALTYSSIAFNAFYVNEKAGYNYQWATDGTPGKYDVQAIATLAIGLSIGVGYSSAADSIMNHATLGAGTRGRDLGSDDLAALQYLYGVEDCLDEVPQPDANCPADGTLSDPPDDGTPSDPPDDGTPSDPPADDDGADDDPPGNGNGDDDGAGSGDGDGNDNGSGRDDGNGSAADDGAQGSEDGGSGLGAAGCASNDQCGADEICSIGGACVPMNKSGGCALASAGPVSTPGAVPTSVFVFCLLGLAVLSAWRRR
jgi:hypothetical protein